jgi:hypothetical protein
VRYVCRLWSYEHIVLCREVVKLGIHSKGLWTELEASLVVRVVVLKQSDITNKDRSLPRGLSETAVIKKAQGYGSN